MPVLEADARPFGDVDHVGVAIYVTAPGFWHAGLLYQLPEEEPRILHLEWHYRLADDQAAAPFRWAQLGIDDANKAVLAALISRIAHRKPGIPYAFDFEGVCFNEETGDLTPPPAGKGLTCATLIIAVLATYGHQLIEIDTWPHRDEDADFCALISHHMRQGGAAEEHVRLVETASTARVRPTEAVGAANRDAGEWPVPFSTAAELSQQVIADLG